MLKEAAEELKRFEKCQKNIESLKERINSDFGLFRLEPFNIPAKEGKWDSFTGNKPSTDALNAINTLAGADVNISIPIDDQVEVERDIISNTERFVYGAIALSDSYKRTIPEELPFHQAVSFFAPMRGWLAVRAYLYLEDGQVVPDIATWDILNAGWISGSRGLVRAYYEREANVDDVEEMYGDAIKSKDIKLSPDNYGNIKLVNAWSKDEEGVIYNGEYLKKEPHGLDHIPVIILPCGSVPLVKTDEYEDTIKNVGESIYVSNRNMYSIANRMSTYFMTTVGKQVKRPKAVVFDSNLGKAPEFDADPEQKGAWIPIDKAKGQEVPTGMDETELTRDAYAFVQNIEQMLTIGGTSPLDHGISSSNGPAAGLNILRHASQIKLNPCVNAIQMVYEWLSHELVSQAKTMKDFEEMEIRGVDGKNRTFQIKVTPDSIDDSWDFKCKLILDMPQDEMANMGMAVQAVQAKLLSKRSARDKYELSKDPDGEQDIIDMEDVAEIGDLKLRIAAAGFAIDGRYDLAQQLETIIQERQQQQTKGTANQPGIPSAVSPSGDTTAAGPATTIKRMLQRFSGG